MGRLEKSVTPDKHDHYFAESIDAFGRQKSVEITPVMGILPQPEISEVRNRTTTSGTGSITSDGTEITVSTGSTSGSTATLDTQEWGRYIPGFEGVYGMRVSVPQDITDDQEVKWGAYNDKNGFIWGEDRDGLFIQLRKGGTDTNKIRDFDKSLPSSFDTSKSIIYRNPYMFYGAGAGFWEVLYGNGNKNIRKTIHGEIPSDHNGLLFNVPNFPLRCEVDNGSTSEDIQAKVTGRQFDVIGKYDPSRKTIDHIRTGITVGTGSLEPIMTFRFKDRESWRSNSVKINEYVVNTDKDLVVKWLYNPDLSGTPSYNTPDGISSSETPIEVDTSATGFNDEGETIFTDIADGADKNNATQGTEGITRKIAFPKFGRISLAMKSIGGSDATIDVVGKCRAEL